MQTTHASPPPGPCRSGPDSETNHRILVVDDNQAIHADFRKILSLDAKVEAFEDEEAKVFGREAAKPQRVPFELDFAFQGQEALTLVQAAVAAGRRYAMVFMDVRMPPGWDGLETTLKLWECDPDLQMVICTAYSDYSWDEMSAKIKSPERVLILKKPFDTIEVLQFAHGLTEKWSLLQIARGNTAALEAAVSERTRELQTSNTELAAEIAERIKNAEVLAESERRFREMMENVELMAVTLDRLGVITFCNDFFLTTTGWRREEAMGSDWFSRFMPGSPEVKKLFFDTIDSGDIPAHYENPIKTKERGLRDVTWNNTMLRDAKGIVTGVASIGEDVTERRCSEQRVREQAALLDKAQDAILVRGLDDTIHFWNKSAQRLYGWTEEEAVGRKATELIYTDTSAFEEARRIVVEKGAWLGELQQRSKAGCEITVESHWTLVRDEQGHPKSILSIHTDVTERNLLKAQLIRAQRMEGLGTLASGIAHDLNNTLSPISLSIELLKAKMPDEDSLSILGICEQSTQRGAAMVRQVLAFARGVSADRVLLRPKYLIAEVEKIAADTFPKSIAIQCAIEPELWNILGDSTQIHQVLLNLCVNARDAMPDGGRLVISAANATLDEAYVAMDGGARVGPYVVMEVRDTGIGIPAAILENIFDPFFTTKKFGEGTGLGLSTSLGIVKSHGGFLRVKSEAGQGTSFQVYLPADCESDHSAVEIHRDDAIRGHGEWVLLVDDESSLRAIAQLVLEDHGYRVLTASDGAAAIAIYAQRRADIAVVLIDMMMPIMDGPTAVTVLRRINPDLKIITSSGLKAHIPQAGDLSGGTYPFLPKPYTAQALLHLISEVLDESDEPAADLAKSFVRGGSRAAEPIRISSLC
jgi:two-component system cell cycle sensor histidine kinase/response regulator CckA